MGNLGASELLFVLLFGLVPAAVGVWVLLWARQVLLDLRASIAAVHARLDELDAAIRTITRGGA